MELLVRIGDLGDVVQLHGVEHVRERFVSHTIDTNCQLLDAHHGEPVAGLASTWTDAKGTTFGRFSVHPGQEQRAAAMQSRPLSLEFTSQRTVNPDATVDGGSVLEHRSALILALAPTDAPARSDAKVLHVEGAPGTSQPPRAQTRSALPEDVPPALRDRLEGRRCYGSTTGTRVVSIT